MYMCVCGYRVLLLSICMFNLSISVRKRLAIQFWKAIPNKNVGSPQKFKWLFKINNLIHNKRYIFLFSSVQFEYQTLKWSRSLTADFWERVWWNRCSHAWMMGHGITSAEDNLVISKLQMHRLLKPESLLLGIYSTGAYTSVKWHKQGYELLLFLLSKRLEIT